MRTSTRRADAQPRKSALRIAPASRSVPAGPVPTRATRLAQSWLDELSQALPSLIPTARVAGLQGLAAGIVRRLRGVASVELATLPGDDKVVLDGARLLVHREYPETLARQPRTKRNLQRCWLYIAHEVAHLAQGIGAKQRVAELHAADGEDTLLQIDLEADHAAAVFVAALREEALTDLKRDSLAMLDAFPVGIGHPPGAAQRKARRSVALAADIEGRAKRILISEDEHAFVHWPRGGGVGALYVRGTHTRHAVAFELGPRDAATFDAAATGPGRSERVSAALRRLLGGASTGG